MPRYFFHRTDGTFERDTEGTELPDADTARTQAVIFAGETLRESPGTVWDGHDLHVEVTDLNDIILFTIVITASSAPAPHSNLLHSPKLS